MNKTHYQPEKGDEDGRAVSRPIPEESRNKDWEHFPDPLLVHISVKFSVMDQILFGAVCRYWRSIYAESRNPKRPLPLLMFPSGEQVQDTDGGQTCSFYSLSQRKVCDLQVTLPGKRFCPGSSHGWLVTVREDHQVSLLNPFLPPCDSKSEIQLPPLTAFQIPPWNDGIWDLPFLMKAVLSADPLTNPNDYVVLAIYGQFCRLAFFKPRDKVWTTLNSEFINMEDVIYSNKYQIFYAVNSKGEVFSGDMNRNIPCPTLSKIAPPTLEHTHKRYLVESASTGDLLQIVRFLDDTETGNYETLGYYTAGFDVLKLDSDGKEWIKMHNLQGCLLFVGDNSSLSLFASDYPGCKSDTIHFTDDYHCGYYISRVAPRDVGVFDYKGGCSLQPQYSLQFTTVVPAPIWIDGPVP